MSNQNFLDLAQARWAEGKHVCVGLDSSPDKISSRLKSGMVSEEVSWLVFNQKIIDVTGDLAAAYKLNAAFYGAEGAMGWLVLYDTIDYAHRHCPRIPVILDGKFGDVIGTNEAYAAMAFDHFQADAVTVNPYLGAEPLEPFLKRPDKGVFVLCRTSNPGAAEIQGLDVVVSSAGQTVKLYEYIATKVDIDKGWNVGGNVGLVVGAPYPRELKRVRGIVGDEMPLLIPGIGKQGGDLEASVRAAGGRMFINASSSVIYASAGPDFSDAARAVVGQMDDKIRATLLDSVR